MEKELRFNSKSLLDIKFEKDVKGYNPLQVDETLDSIIEDYELYQKEVLESDNKISKLTNEINSLKTKLRETEIELAKAKDSLKGVSSTVNYSKDNISYIKRIAALERALYQKGVDPKKI